MLRNRMVISPLVFSSCVTLCHCLLRNRFDFPFYGCDERRFPKSTYMFSFLAIGRSRSEFFFSKHRPDFGFALPAGPKLPMKLHEVRCGCDSFLHGLEFEDCKTPNDFLGL